MGHREGANGGQEVRILGWDRKPSLPVETWLRAFLCQGERKGECVLTDFVLGWTQRLLATCMTRMQEIVGARPYSEACWGAWQAGGMM